MSASEIFRNSIANKKGLSLLLDQTLKKSHKMSVFGIGFMNSLSCKNNYISFVTSHYHIYNEMENQLDKSNLKIWNNYGNDLNRTKLIIHDLNAIGVTNIESLTKSESTNLYCNRIKKVGKESPELLIG